MLLARITASSASICFVFCAAVFILNTSLRALTLCPVINLKSLTKAAPTIISPGPAIKFPIPVNIPFISLLPCSGSKAFTKASEIELNILSKF